MQTHTSKQTYTTSFQILLQPQFMIITHSIRQNVTSENETAFLNWLRINTSWIQRSVNEHTVVREELDSKEGRTMSRLKVS
jgi:hypothetical protein